MFSTLPKRNLNFLDTFNLSSANALNLVKCKVLSFGKGLRKASWQTFVSISLALWPLESKQEFTGFVQKTVFLTQNDPISNLCDTLTRQIFWPRFLPINLHLQTQESMHHFSKTGLECYLLILCDAILHLTYFFIICDPILHLDNMRPTNTFWPRFITI